jgi:hypothetical protein
MKRTLQVSLHAREPSVVELTVAERVQLDRLHPSTQGYLAERHGSLLEPGMTTLTLAEGHYFFKTLSDVHLKVVRGGVDTSTGTNNKSDVPTLPAKADDPAAKGDEPSGEPPSLTLEARTRVIDDLPCLREGGGPTCVGAA